MGPKMIFGWICSLTLTVSLSIGFFATPVNTYECRVDIPVEQKTCDRNNSIVLESELLSGNINDFCNYTVSQYACAQCNVLAQLTNENLTSIFECFVITRPVNISDLNATTLFMQKISLPKLEILLKEFNRKINDTLTIPLMSKETILQAIWERYKTDPKINITTFMDTFTQLLMPFIAGISQPILDSLQYSDIMCENFKALVHGVSAGLTEMDFHIKKSLEKWIIGYINATGLDCIANISESNEWLLKNWEFINGLIFPENLTSANSGDVSTAVVQNETVKEVLLTSIIGSLKPLFPVFTPLNFSQWFQVKLPQVLPAITGPELTTIPTNITCESYQAILKGFDTVLLSLKSFQFSELFNFSKNILTSQLNSSGSACAGNMTGSREWVEKNFLKSMQGLNLSDLFALNPNFSGFEVLDLLTPQLLAELTVSPQAWFNADRIDQIFDTLTDRNFSDLDTYFTYFNYDTRMMNITTFANTTVRDRMLHRIIRLLQPLFSSFNASDFAKWFQDSLIMLLPSITGSNLGAIPTSISCESYRAIIQGLDNLYPNLSKSQLNDVYNFSRTFLNLQSDSHGIGSVPCTDNTTGLRDWLQKNFLKFVAEITFSDMPFINTQYYLFEILDLLSIPELSGLTVESLNHTSRINQIIDILRNRTYGDLIGYVTQFINDTRVRNITAIQPFSTSRAILTGIISQLRSYFTRFNGADFAEWFQDRLHLLLPAIDYKLLELIPTDISCESYQAIMKGLDNVYLHLTLAQNHDIYTFSKRFLSFQHSLSGSVGIACAENAKGTLEWIIKNFLRFLSEFQFHDFTDLNKNFSAVLPSQQ
ncbi:uncharacterized protein LOC116985444 [Amblyraja radiata]|uniref:uncharacterized protein LOC116985444 n=1 Tax=Amblyraja radiata TaxID=386614 RepID=UPI001403F219|nr:uncharacterized protein LOC116985444 [Amblyraja radiata]